MLTIFFLSIIFFIIQTEDVYIGTYELNSDCNTSALIYAYKVGELKGSCVKTRFMELELYVRSTCNDNYGIYRFDFFSNEYCFGESDYNVQLDIHGNCSLVEESDVFKMKGFCNFQQPEHKIHMGLYLDDDCKQEDLTMDLLFNPGKCMDTTQFPDITSASFKCQDGVGMFYNFQDDKCVNVIGSPETMKKGQCIPIDKNPLRDLVVRNMKRLNFGSTPEPAAIMMIDDCT